MKRNPFARNEVRSPKPEVKLRFPSRPAHCSLHLLMRMRAQLVYTEAGVQTVSSSTSNTRLIWFRGVRAKSATVDTCVQQST